MTTTDPYRLDELPSGDVRLSADARGEALARALGGRFVREPRGYILTPAAGRKWEVLFLNGWSAKRVMRRGLWLVAFERGGRVENLAGAVKLSQPDHP